MSGRPPALSPTRAKVLQKLYEGWYAASIAEELELTRQAVGYHVREMETDGLIAVDHAQTAFQRRVLGPAVAIKIYGLTDEGLAALQAAHCLEEGASPGGRSDGKGERLHSGRAPEPRVEVHNFEVKVPVVEGEIEWLPEKAELNNWTRKWDPNFHGTYLEVTTKHILLRAAAEGSSRAVAEGLCLRKLLRVMELLEERYRLKLGRPKFRVDYRPGRAKIGVVGHPLARGKGYEEGRLGVIDSTPEPGTIHPRDPNDADRIVMMGRRIERMETMLEALHQHISTETPQIADGPGDTAVRPQLRIE